MKPYHTYFTLTFLSVEWTSTTNTTRWTETEGLMLVGGGYCNGLLLYKDSPIISSFLGINSLKMLSKLFARVKIKETISVNITFFYVFGLGWLVHRIKCITSLCIHICIHLHEIVLGTQNKINVDSQTCSNGRTETEMNVHNE